LQQPLRNSKANAACATGDDRISAGKIDLVHGRGG
jgi:hypothetical protein